MVLPSQAARPTSDPTVPASADEDDESLLDPAVERIRQRLKRLIFISVATLMLGLLAVIIAVVYKVAPVRDKSGLAARSGESVVADVLPPGARVLSSALDGRLLALTIADGAATRILVIDLEDGKVLRRLSLGGGNAPATP